MYLAKNKKSGNWYLYYKIENGKITSVPTGTTSERLAKKFRDNFNIQNSHQVKLSSIKLSEAITEYLNYADDRNEPSTIMNKKIIYKKFLSVVGDKPIEYISIFDIYKYQNQILKYVKKITVNTNISKIRSVFSYAKQRKWIKENIFEDINKLPVPDKQRQAMNNDEVSKFLSIVDDKNDKFLYTFALHTGLRLNELRNLKYINIDQANHTVSILNDEQFRTKGKKNREIPLTDTIFNMIDFHNLPSNHLFVPYSKTHYNRRFKKYCKMAELNQIFHFHSLRHTFATNYLNNGGNIYFLQKFLGHSNIKTTENYLHCISDEMKKSINRISYIA